jgi:glucose/arabinose dehydrogenase
MGPSPSLGAAIALALTLLPGIAAAQLRAVPFVNGLNLPIGFVQDPSNADVQYVVEQRGIVRVINRGTVASVPFLDVSTLVSLGGERGLLGLALPPDYGATGRFYVYYTRQGGGAPEEVGDIVVSRYTRSAGNPFVADPASRKDLVWGTLAYIEHSGFGNHNGGHMAFGPDGYLYLAVGDGGGGQDPTNNAQNPATYLGKILRIDVNVAAAHPAGYVVPPTNPFLDGDPVAALPEIWAFGVRNPWKFSFDDYRGTDALVIADVGQGAWEEVNWEAPNSGGRNYGWRNREGRHDNQGNVFAPVPPAYLPLIDPIFEYDHAVGASITGGFVYRGTALGPAYRGRYFFADFVRGRVWSLGLAVDPATGAAVALDVTEHTAELGGSATLGAITAFGRDANGELYIVSYTGTIFRLVDLSADERQIMLFKYNNDPYKDVLVYNRTSGEWSIRLGNASATLDPGPTGGWSAGWKIFVANFNADAFDDLFLYSESSGNWYKVINTGSGFTYFGQGWQPGFRVHIVDFNADGRSDVFLYNPSTGAWFTCVSTGTGVGGFDYGGGGWRAGWHVLPADFDADGRTDFLLYDPVSGGFFKAFTRGNGTFSYSGGGWAPGWTPIVARLNGDGRDDVFLYNAANGAWFWATSTGDGTGGFDYAMGGWAPGWEVYAADLCCGEGRTDFFLYRPDGSWYEAINIGGSFNYYNGVWSRWTLMLDDMNGDGRAEVFLYDPGTGVWYQATISSGPGQFRYTTGSPLF